MVRVRFAPSPTGPLHIGGARTALFNYAVARKERGSFILRIDDTDEERSQKEFEENIFSSLRWLGLEWDEGPGVPAGVMKYRQSERIDRYVQARDELTSRDKAYRDHEGVIRLRYPRGKIIVHDLICGECIFPVGALGPEPVLFRSDGRPTYHLASVCDDIDMKISHVIRGQDHLTNTAKHQVIFAALGAEPPQFAHLPLILGEDRSKLSKRHSEGLVSVDDFKNAGYLSEAVINFLMLLGWSHPDAKELLSIAEFLEHFDLSRVGKTAAVFEKRKLDYLNGWWLRHLPAQEVSSRALSFTGPWQDELAQLSGKYWTEAFSQLRDGIGNLVESEILAQYLCADTIDLDQGAVTEVGLNVESCSAVAAAWLELLTDNPPAPHNEAYNESEYRQLVSMLKKKTGFNGQALFKPLRIAIISRVSGPELKVLVPLIRYARLISRAEFVNKQLKML